MRSIWSLLLLLIMSPMVLPAEESPAAILDHVRTVYGELSSYSDTGTVLYEYTATLHDEHTFTTAFTRAPRHFILDFHKHSNDRIVIWGESDAFHEWWKGTGQVNDFPNPKNTGAFSLSEFPTNAVSTKIPPMLYAKANMPGAIQDFAPEKTISQESCGEQKMCYRLEGTTSNTYGSTGARVNIRKLTLWIESETYLVRKVVEEAPAAPGNLNRTTTSFIPRANPKLADDVFNFTPPK